MSIDQKYIAGISLQEYLVDKTTGEPLADGVVYFYKDNSRTVLKNIYRLSGSPPNYSFVALPNPITLSSVGTVQYNNSDIIPYYYPWDENDPNTVDLYYVVVQSSTGVPQFTREAWPPNVIENSSSTADLGRENFIPNGQFLAHNDLPDDGLIGASTAVTNIAQGGWSFVRNSPSTAVDYITFPVNNYSESPSGSPQFLCNLENTHTSSDTKKDIRIKFRDVNKFASNDQKYTFSFWAQADGDINVQARLIKNYGTGGSPSSESDNAIDDGAFTVTTVGTQFNVSFVFGANSNVTFGTNNDSYVEIALRFPRDVTFSCSVSDFVLTLFDETNPEILAFPSQTDASMLSQGVAGWMDIPNPDGSDLYLPLVLTRQGMVFDDSEVGMVKSTVNVGTLPSYKDCDGSAYVTQDYDTTDFIPYSRLFNKLYNNGNSYNIPIFGTGSDYLSSYVGQSNTAQIFVTTNKIATGTFATPSNGATSPTFSYTTPYSAAASGYDTNAYLQASDLILGICQTTGSVLANVSAGTSGFTVSQVLNEALLKGQFTVETVAASGLANPGGAGLYFKFSNTTTTYYVWFHFTDETDPAPGGTGIRVEMDTAYTAGEVANIVASVINNKQISIITCVAASAITNSSYFQILSQEHTYWVWYNKDGGGTAPSAGNVLIEVDIVAADTSAEVATKTLKAMNSYQYAVPDFRGMFLRGSGSSSVDPNSSTRYSNVFSIYGNQLGTFEQYNIQSHLHGLPGSMVDLTTAGANTYPAGGFLEITSPDTELTGGNETRPVNAYVRYVIKY